jgi:hypothetical protein
MLELDESTVDASAPNAAAIKNGRMLVAKGSFTKLARTEDDTLLFGVCKGSGKEPYQCSCDFIQPDKPVHRCSCPSHQFPCKHCLGLMYAYVQKKPFVVDQPPDDVVSKREKVEARTEKKKEAESKPRVVNKSALAKKIKAQQDGLELLERITQDLVRIGMGNMSAKSAKQIEEQGKQLSDAYLPGAQAALQAFTKYFAGSDGQVGADVDTRKRERIFSDALDQLTRLNAIVKQGRDYLAKQLADPEMKPEPQTSIAAWLGHAWQLRDLKDAGLVQANAELIQLAFHSHDDVARKEFVDTGIWMNLATGKIQQTQTFRPYKAVKFIKGEDSFFRVAQVPELCVYPGDVNPRIRWDAMTSRAVEKTDLDTVRKQAATTFATLIKEVKGALKGPLADKHPVYAIRFERVGKIANQLLMEDSTGGRLVLADAGIDEEPATCHLLEMLPSSLHRQQVLICRFRHDLDSRQLRVKPLAVVTEDAVIRLTF